MSKTIIAGPCSAESREQLYSVACALRRTGRVAKIRAGVWKPRTRPGAFEGLGEPALGWMQEIGNELGVEFCCEVARPEHVELCLHHGLTTVWIGARTTTNPFMMEEICQALRGTAVSVMVKNPMCPDVRLWLGAIERLRQAAIDDITAVHRGFSMYHNNGYRNAPLWEVAMEFRREMPEVPILCDPSHMGGRADLVASLAAAARQLDYNGLMVEVHPHPADAWTDAAQQITPDELAAIADAFLAPAAESRETSAADMLQALRGEIDTIDHSLLRLLARRMDLSRQIATVKQRTGMAVYQQRRWSDVVEDRRHLADDLGLDTAFTKEILEKIHAESVRIQMEM